MPPSRPAACALAAVLLAACTSDGSGTDAPHQAKAFTCPAPKAVSTALGTTVRGPKKSMMGDRTALCSYTATDLASNALVSVTFGAGDGDYATTLKVLAPTSRTPVSGLGDQADALVSDGIHQLFVRSGTRIISVTSDPDDVRTESAIARLFLG